MSDLELSLDHEGHIDTPTDDRSTTTDPRQATTDPRQATTDAPAAIPVGTNVVGERLRDIRRQQDLSLADVEARSGGTWKAVVVGAYERGDRAVTISRLAELAAFYGVPLASLLPARSADGEPRRRRGDDGDDGRLKLDLQRLDEADDAVLDPIALRAVARFAGHIQLRRGDHNGRVLTVRSDDLRTIAVAIGEDPAKLIDALRDQGAVVS